MTAQPLLDVANLTVEFATRRGIVKAVQHVNISVAKGETLGIVGESGSGKSVTSYAVMRILDRAGRLGVRTQAYHRRRAHYLTQAGRSADAAQELQRGGLRLLRRSADRDARGHLRGAGGRRARAARSPHAG